MEQEPDIPDDLGRLVAFGSRRHFRPFKRVFLVWGIALPLAGAGSTLSGQNSYISSARDLRSEGRLRRVKST